MSDKIAIQLPFEFDKVRLAEEVRQLPQEAYSEVYNPYLDVDTLSFVELIEPVADANGDVEFVPNKHLQGKPYLLEILETFKCYKTTFRIQTLKIGGEIREHRDVCRRFEDGIIRLHIPIQSAPGMTTYLDRKQVDMQEGTCWYLDLTYFHQMINNSNQDRVHLIIDCQRNEWWEEHFSQLVFSTKSQFGTMTLNEMKDYYLRIQEQDHPSFNETRIQLQKEIDLRST